MKAILIIITIVFLLGIVNYFNKDKINTYNILEGNHFCEERKIHKTNGRVAFKFKFSNCHTYYKKIDSSHINKLFGLTTFNIKKKESFGIHKDSVRIGWRNINIKKFELFLYMYIDGKREITPIGVVEKGEELVFEIDTRRGWDISFRDKVYKISDGVKCKYLTYPYFGGSVVSPWFMYFDIEIL